MYDAVNDAGGVRGDADAPVLNQDACPQIVRPTVPGAGHGAVFDLPIAEGPSLMQAQIIDGKEASVQPENRDLAAADEDLFAAAKWEIVD